MRLLLITLYFIACLISCRSRIEQFYPDSYFSEDKIYRNESLGFSLLFQGNWYIETDPNYMERNVGDFAQTLRERGAELMFIGATVEGSQGVRGIVINYNASVKEYAEQVRDINKKDVSVDSGLTSIVINGKPMVRWNYTFSSFRYVEFFFTIDTYNIRIAFWAKPDLFFRFYPVYLNIMTSLELVN